MPRLFVALPAYNEEDCLPPLLNSFRRIFQQMDPNYHPLMIIVDDGSKDRTAQIVRNAAAKGYPVILVQHPVNKGLGEAIKTGLREVAARSTSPDDVLICMDADDTHPPRFIIPMIAKMNRTGADLVIASRFRKGSQQHGVPFNRQLLSLGALVLFKVFLNLKGVRDYTCGFRAYRLSMVNKSLQHYGENIITRAGFACTDQLLVNMACIGAKITEVPFVLRYDRKVGESKLQLNTTIIETLKLLVHGNTALREARRKGLR
ncbi:MAG: glycosyltransferase [Sumerlaeia bacterium]